MGDPVEVTVPPVSSVPLAKIISTEKEPIETTSEVPASKETITTTATTSAPSATITIGTTTAKAATTAINTAGPESVSVSVEATATITASTSSAAELAGATSEADKKISRAQRFGIVTSAKEIAASVVAKKSASTEVDLELAEKLKSRAQKFGVISPLLLQEEAAKLKQEQVCYFYF